jgi:tetratricopeptide (TPR) repeat protein
MFKKIFLIVVFPIILLAQTSDFDRRVETGIEQIYSINFPEAEKTFKKLNTDYPNHPAGKFFLAMIDWWRILLDPDDEQYDDSFNQKLENVIDFCDKILEKDPKNVDALFFKGGSIGFRGRLSVMRESWLSAASDGREALPIVEEAASLDPKNVDVQFGFGLYNYYASVIPEENPVVKPLMMFFPDADKKKGIKQLKNTAENGKWGKYEARYFLMNLYYNYEKEYKTADKYAQSLCDSFPNNPVFEKWRGRIAVKQNDWTLSDSIFRDVSNKSKNKITGYDNFKTKRETAYYIAYSYRYHGQSDSALVYFKKCIDYEKQLNLDDETGFMVNSTLYSGTIKEAQGKYSEAIKYYEKVLDMDEYGNSHDLAESYIENLKKRNKN